MELIVDAQSPALPTEYFKELEGAWSLASAYQYCEQIAAQNPEFFPLRTHLLPTNLRKHIWAVYAFARIADDFVDEPRFEKYRIAALNEWETLLESAFRSGAPSHPVFVALQATVSERQIPIAPFRALLDGLRIDLSKDHFRRFDELKEYLSLSAASIGEVVLYIHGHHEPERLRFNDALCTALALTDILQDLSLDLQHGHCYIPDEDLLHFGVTREDLLHAKHDQAFKNMMKFLIARAKTWFERGSPLIQLVSGSLSLELDTARRAGLRVLREIEECDYEVLDFQPQLRKRSVARLSVRSILSFAKRMLHDQVTPQN